MNEVVESRVRKIRAFGRIARGLCSATSVVIVLGAITWGLLFPSPRPHATLEVGALSLSGDLASPSMRVWITAVMLIDVALGFRCLILLRRIFDHLARGEIYSAGPVRALQALGRVMLMAAAFQVFVPVATVMLVQLAVIELPATADYSVNFSFGLLSGFAAAGIVLLLSWILDVGLSLREETETLRQEAELVV